MLGQVRSGKLSPNRILHISLENIQFKATPSVYWHVSYKFVEQNERTPNAKNRSVLDYESLHKPEHLDWTIGVLGFHSRQGLGTFLFTTASRTALGPTQPPIQWVPRALSLVVKWPGREAIPSLP